MFDEHFKAGNHYLQGAESKEEPKAEEALNAYLLAIRAYQDKDRASLKPLADNMIKALQALLVAGYRDCSIVLALWTAFPDKNIKEELKRRLVEMAAEHYRSKDYSKGLALYTLLIQLPGWSIKESKGYSAAIEKCYQEALKEGKEALQNRNFAIFYRSCTTLLSCLAQRFEPKLFNLSASFLRFLLTEPMQNESVLLNSKNLENTKASSYLRIHSLRISLFNAGSFLGAEVPEYLKIVKMARLGLCRAYLFLAWIKQSEGKDAQLEFDRAKKGIELLYEKEDNLLEYYACLIFRAHEKYARQFDGTWERFQSHFEANRPALEEEKHFSRAKQETTNKPAISELLAEGLCLYKTHLANVALKRIAKLGYKGVMEESATHLQVAAVEALSYDPCTNFAVEYYLAATLTLLEQVSSDSPELLRQASIYSNLLVALKPEEACYYYLRGKVQQLWGRSDAALFDFRQAVKWACKNPKMQLPLVLLSPEFRKLIEKLPKEEAEPALKLLEKQVDVHWLNQLLNELSSKGDYQKRAFLCPLIEWLLVTANDRISLSEPARKALLKVVRHLQRMNQIDGLQRYILYTRSDSFLKDSLAKSYAAYKEVELGKADFCHEPGQENLIAYLPLTEPEDLADEAEINALESLLKQMSKGKYLSQADELSYDLIIATLYRKAVLRQAKELYGKEEDRDYLWAAHQFIAQKFPAYARQMQEANRALGFYDKAFVQRRFSSLLQEAEAQISEDRNTEEAFKALDRLFDFIKTAPVSDRRSFFEQGLATLKKLHAAVFLKIATHAALDQLAELRQYCLLIVQTPLRNSLEEVPRDLRDLLAYTIDNHIVRAYALTILQCLAIYHGVEVTEFEDRKNFYSYVRVYSPKNERIQHYELLAKYVKRILDIERKGSLKPYLAFMRDHPQPLNSIESLKTDQASLALRLKMGEVMRLATVMVQAEEGREEVKKAIAAQDESEIEKLAEAFTAQNRLVLAELPYDAATLNNCVYHCIQKLDNQHSVPKDQQDCAYFYLSLALALEASPIYLHNRGIVRGYLGHTETEILDYRQGAALLREDEEVASILWNKITLLFINPNEVEYMFVASDANISTGESYILEASKHAKSNYKKAALLFALGEHLVRSNLHIKPDLSFKQVPEPERKELLKRVAKLQFDLHLKAFEKLLSQASTSTLISEGMDKSFSLYLERLIGMHYLFRDLAAEIFSSESYASFYDLDNALSASSLDDLQEAEALKNMKRLLEKLRSKSSFSLEDKNTFAFLHRALYVKALVKQADLHSKNKNYEAAVGGYEFIKNKFPSYARDMELRIQHSRQGQQAVLEHKEEDQKNARAARLEAFERQKEADFAKKDKRIEDLRSELQKIKDQNKLKQSSVDEVAQQVLEAEKQPSEEAALNIRKEEQSVKRRALEIELKKLEEAISKGMENNQKMEEEKRRVVQAKPRRLRRMFRLLVQKSIGIAKIIRINDETKQLAQDVQKQQRELHQLFVLGSAYVQRRVDKKEQSLRVVSQLTQEYLAANTRLREEKEQIRADLGLAIEQSDEQLLRQDAEIMALEQQLRAGSLIIQDCEQQIASYRSVLGYPVQQESRLFTPQSRAAMHLQPPGYQSPTPK